MLNNIKYSHKILLQLQNLQLSMKKEKVLFFHFSLEYILVVLQ